MSSMKQWEKKVLAAPGAPERVTQIEEGLRLAAGLTALREKAGLSQRELAERIGVRQPRVAAIERSRNVTFDVLERYVAALGGHIELSVVHGGTKIPLISGHRTTPAARTTAAKSAARKNAPRKATPAKKVSVKTAHAKRAAAPQVTTAKRTARRKSA